MKVRELFEGAGDYYLMDQKPKLIGAALKERNDIPRIVKGQFAVNSNELTSLEGGPEEVQGDYFCQYNNLTSLKFVASKIGVNLYCNNNPITSLQGIGKLFQGGYIGAVIYLPESINSNILGILQINKLKTLAFLRNPTSFTKDRTLHKVQEILTKHMQLDKDILECQEELITNGLKEYAKL